MFKKLSVKGSNVWTDENGNRVPVAKVADSYNEMVETVQDMSELSNKNQPSSWVMYTLSVLAGVVLSVFLVLLWQIRGEIWTGVKFVVIVIVIVALMSALVAGTAWAIVTFDKHLKNRPSKEERKTVKRKKDLEGLNTSSQ